MPIERVHLHEVGALDSIIDIVGAVYGFEWLGIETSCRRRSTSAAEPCSCAHGVFPVPAPATARLLLNVPVYGNGTSELVTPTGALLVTPYARAFGPLPAMRLERIGTARATGIRRTPRTSCGSSWASGRPRPRPSGSCRSSARSTT